MQSAHMLERRAFDRLRWVKLYAQLHKYEFLKDKVDYLGFEVGRDGIRTSPEKVRGNFGLAPATINTRR